MSGKTKWLLATSLVASMAFVVPVEAASKKAPVGKAPTNAELLERIEKLESDLAKTKDDAKSTKAKVVDIKAKQDEVSISMDNGRPTFKSGDGRFSLALRARVQADFASFMQSDAGIGNTRKQQTGFGVPAGFFDRGSGSTVRRAYLGIEGLFFKDFWYEFRLDAGGSSASGKAGINLARVSYIGIPHFRINAGIIQPVFTYGDTVSSGNLMFIERAEIDNIAVGNFGGSDSRRGVEMTFAKDNFLYGGDNLILSAAYTGATTETANGLGGDEQEQVLGRAAYRFYSDANSNFQVGVSGAQLIHRNPTIGALTLEDNPEIRVTDSKLISAAVANVQRGTMYGFDAEAQYKNFYVGGEYHKYVLDRANAPGSSVRNKDAEFGGWYVEGSWVITGEAKQYSKESKGNEYGSWGAPKVVKPFSLSGNSWGAWELAVRYSDTDLNWNANSVSGVAGGEEKVWAFGVNWYLNNNVKLQVNNLVVNVERSSGAGLTNNYLGQNMNVIAGRLQFAM